MHCKIAADSGSIFNVHVLLKPNSCHHIFTIYPQRNHTDLGHRCFCHLRTHISFTDVLFQSVMQKCLCFSAILIYLAVQKSRSAKQVQFSLKNMLPFPKWPLTSVLAACYITEINKYRGDTPLDVRFLKKFPGMLGN